MCQNGSWHFGHSPPPVCALSGCPDVSSSQSLKIARKFNNALIEARCHPGHVINGTVSQVGDSVIPWLCEKMELSVASQSSYQIAPTEGLASPRPICSRDSLDDNDIILLAKKAEEISGVNHKRVMKRDGCGYSPFTIFPYLAFIKSLLTSLVLILNNINKYELKKKISSFIN